jgi:hypothetical protein
VVARAFGGGAVPPSPALRWVMKEPPNIKAEPTACKTVKISCSVATASNMANGTCS